MTSLRCAILAPFTALLLLSSCENQKHDLINNESFNEEETEQLITLLEKFDNTICEIEEESNSDIANCYNSFFQRIASEVDSGYYTIGIDSTRQEEILSSLTPDLNAQIWYVGKGVLNRRYPKGTRNFYPDTVKSVTLYPRGNYLDYMNNELADINSNTSYYVNRLQAAGSISPSMFADVIIDYSEYDITDERIRLLIAVHYLTLNQNNLIHEKSYENLEKEM